MPPDRWKPVPVDAYRAECDLFEARYGVQSEYLMEAFTDPSGRFRETEDMRRWDFVFSVWKRAAGIQSDTTRGRPG